MFNLNDITLHQQHQTELQREAEQERLIRKALRALPRREDEAEITLIQLPKFKLVVSMG